MVILCPIPLELRAKLMGGSDILLLPGASDLAQSANTYSRPSGELSPRLLPRYHGLKVVHDTGRTGHSVVRHRSNAWGH